MESGNGYVLQLKGNQKNLKHAVEKMITNSDPIDTDQTKEKNKGRLEERNVHVYDDLTDPIFQQWPSVKRVVHVISKGKRGKKEYLENRYYISSEIDQNAKQFNLGIRAHWGIENELHWVKDVILNEDKSLVRSMKSSENSSIFRNIVINLFRIKGYKSIQYAIEKFTNKIPKCLNLICN